jgi:hypothetical protein
VTTTGFSRLAQLTAKAGGVEDLRIAEYPGPLGIHDVDTVSRNVATVLIDAVVAGLTERGDHAVGNARSTDGIAFTGTADEVCDYFHQQGWSDGLPIVPPTRDRIKAFLAFVDQPADAEIAVLASANLRATARNIAANAVMAGCRPEHMPVIVAAVEALGDERVSLNNIGSSSGIFPFVLINGPIAGELGIHSGAQLVSRYPNPAIGRAVGLIVRNIAGFRPGESYMGTFGYPLAFALAEHPDSPWPPFNVEHGYDAAENTVTVGVTNNWGAAPAPYDTPERGGAATALELLCKEITGKTRIFQFPGHGPNAEHVMLTLLVSPPVAKSLAAAGYSKDAVRRHVHENTRMRLGDFEWRLHYTNIFPTTARERVAAGVFPAEFLGPADSLVRVLSGPDILHIVVCGDPHRNRVMVLEGGHTRPTTKRIRLPADWHALLRRSARDAS